MKKRPIAIAIVVIAVALFLYLAPVYYYNPGRCLEYCSPEYRSPTYQWVYRSLGHYGIFGAAYVVEGLPCGRLIPTCPPKPEYTIWFGFDHWDLFL